MHSVAAMTITEQLSGLDDEDFEDLVKDDARSRTSPEVADALRSPILARRWYLALRKMLMSVEGQLAAMTAENTAKVQRLYAARQPRQAMIEQADFAAWRANSLRFKNGVDMRLLEARELLREHDSLDRVAVLERAIARHRDAADEASEADLRLWSVIGKGA